MFTQGSSSRKKFSYENAVFLVHTMQRQTAEMKEFVEHHPDEWVATQPLVETIRELAEVIVWGDKFEEAVFMVFLENNVMQIFEDLVLYSRCPSTVRVQVIQAINILLQNLTNQPSLFSVCSNNHLNRIIQLEVDPDDEELQSIYVSFLKTLCLRLNQDTVQFFFQQPSLLSPTTKNPAVILAGSDKNSEGPPTTTTTSPRPDARLHDEPPSKPGDNAASTSEGSTGSGSAGTPGPVTAVDALVSVHEFPLMSQAVILLSSEDTIVRTAARQIVVTVLQLSDDGVVDYLKRTMEAVLRHFVRLIGKQVKWLLDRVWARCHFSDGGGRAAAGGNSAPWATVGAMDHHMEDLLDDMYYINDLFQVPHAFVAETLRTVVESEIVDGMVVRSIDACLNDANTDTPSCALSIALLVCAHWLRVNTTPAIHSMLTLRLLAEPQYDAPSRLVSILKSDRLVGSHALALSVIHAWWSSKFTDDTARKNLVGASPDDAEKPPTASTPSSSIAVENRARGEAWSWESIRSTLGRYRASLQRGALYEQTSAAAEALKLPASVASQPLLAAVANSLQLQVRHKEATRFVALEITVSSVFLLFQWIPGDAVELVFKRAAVEAQHNLLLRVELYRQHLWMLYGATGENSLLTPSSFLCQLLHRDADREISDPLEAVFARLELEYDTIVSAIRAAIPLRSTSVDTGSCPIDLQPTQKLTRDVALLCPLMPPLACWSAAAANSLQGELRHADKHVNAYLALQQKGNAGVPVWRRAPQDEDEMEHIELSSWLLLRYVLLTLCRGAVDPLEDIVKRSQCQRVQGDVVRAWDLTAMVDVPAVRCEFTPDGPVPSPSPAPGCVLYLFIVGSDILLVAPNKESPESLGTVAFSLRAMYCEAIVHSRQLFKLRVVEDAPNASGTRTVSIVLRDRSVCQKTAQAIQCRATHWKRESCATLWTLILDEPQRVIQDLFRVV